MADFAGDLWIVLAVCTGAAVELQVAAVLAGSCFGLRKVEWLLTKHPYPSTEIKDY
jgi:hypothetical protein